MSKHLKLGLVSLLSLAATLFNPWFWRISSSSIILALIILTAAIVLSAALTFRYQKLFILASVILIGLSIYLVVFDFDRNLLTSSGIEKAALETRVSYYPHHLGKILHNNYTLTAYKIERNFITNLSFSQFFFDGKPRLRGYAYDYPKLTPSYLAFFILGVIFIYPMRVSRIYVALVFIVLLILSLFNPNSGLGPIPLLSMIVATSVNGLVRSLSILAKYFNINA